MGGYLILIAFGVVFVALVIHVVRTPRMPARRPFKSEENSLIGESKAPQFTRATRVRGGASTA